MIVHTLHEERDSPESDLTIIEDEIVIMVSPMYFGPIEQLSIELDVL